MGQVEFVDWIEGLPTQVVKVRPWALFINLTSSDLYLGLWPGSMTSHDPTEEEQDYDEDDEEVYSIPPKGVFAPPSLQFNMVRKTRNFRFISFLP